jgi:hypothetical protein
MIQKMFLLIFKVVIKNKNTKLKDVSLWTQGLTIILGWETQA